MLFPKYQELVEPPGWNSIATSTTLLPAGATTVRVPITREKHVERMYLRVILMSNNSNTVLLPANDGLAGMIKRVTFTANNRQYINNVSGSTLIALAGNYDAVDPFTDAAVNLPLSATLPLPVNYQYEVTYPIYFGHPQMTEPLRDAFIIPMPNFNEDGVLEITFDAWSNFAVISGTGGSATISAQLTINRWHAPNNLPHVVHELNEYDLLLNGSGRAQYELPALGSYTGVLLRQFNSSGQEADLCKVGYISMELASTAIRKSRTANLIRENLLSKTSLMTPAGTLLGFSNVGTTYFDFLNDGFGPVPSLNSVIDANPSATGGARFRISADLSAAGTFRVVGHRLYGDLTTLKLTGAPTSAAA